MVVTNNLERLRERMFQRHKQLDDAIRNTKNPRSTGYYKKQLDTVEVEISRLSRRMFDQSPLL